MSSFGASTDFIDVQTTPFVPFGENRRRKRHSKRRNRSRNPQSHLVFLQFFSQPPSPLLSTPTSSLYRPLPFHHLFVLVRPFSSRQRLSRFAVSVFILFPFLLFYRPRFRALQSRAPLPSSASARRPPILDDVPTCRVVSS